MTNIYYAVHSGIDKGVYDSWDKTKINVEGITNAVYRKFENFYEAEHFSEHGVLPWNHDIQTIHVFICEKETYYCIYFEMPGAKPIIEKVPIEWEEKNPMRRRELSSLLALSKTLEICSTDQKLLRKQIIIHFQFPYAYNCVTKWIKKWKKNGWIKQNNIKVSNPILLQIIDAQQNALLNVHYNYIYDKNLISGISGFQKAKIK